jgi:hypothetical protein
MNVEVRSRNGFKLFVQLPKEYDERTRLAQAPSGDIIVTHPEHPPLRVTKNGELKKLPV